MPGGERRLRERQRLSAERLLHPAPHKYTTLCASRDLESAAHTPGASPRLGVHHATVGNAPKLSTGCVKNPAGAAAAANVSAQTGLPSTDIHVLSVVDQIGVAAATIGKENLY